MFRRQFLFLTATLAAHESSGGPVWTGVGVNALGSPSRDGKLLTCVDPGTRDLAVRDVATGAMRRLTHKPVGSAEFAYFSVFSPDAQSIAYAWNNRQGYYDLRSIKADGGEGRVLYANPEAGFLQPCAWSPDGKQILTLFFRKDNISQIAMVSAADGSVRVLKSLSWVYPKRMDFSPDGRYIVYDTFAGTGQGPRDIFVLSVDASQETRLIGNPADDLFPLWSHDGRHIVFVSDRLGATDLFAVPVRAGKEAGEPFAVQRNLGRILPLGLTGANELFYGVDAGGGAAARLVPLDGSSDPVNIPGALTPPEFSPDGTAVAYLVRSGPENYGNESRAICVHAVATGAARILPAKLAHIEHMSWAPDSSRLLVSGSDGKGRAGLFTVAAEDGMTRPVVIDAVSFRGIEGAWMGSERIAYVRDGIRSLDLAQPGEDSVIYSASAAVTGLAALNGSLAFKDGESLIILRDKKVLFRQRMPGVRQLAWSGPRLLLLREGLIESLDPASARISRVLPERYEGNQISASPTHVALATGGKRMEIWRTGPLFPAN